MGTSEGNQEHLPMKEVGEGSFYSSFSHMFSLSLFFSLFLVPWGKHCY